MMMTPAGTIALARVFVIGAGVAGPRAIAPAKRLGARVEAFDTRPAVAEEVRSLGARFVEIDVGEVGRTDQGYARELTPEQAAPQKEGMKQVVADADVVIATAQVFGRRAPVIVSSDMVEAMRPGPGASSWTWRWNPAATWRVPCSGRSRSSTASGWTGGAVCRRPSLAMHRTCAPPTWRISSMVPGAWRACWLDGLRCTAARFPRLPVSSSCCRFSSAGSRRPGRSSRGENSRRS